MLPIALLKPFAKVLVPVLLTGVMVLDVGWQTLFADHKAINMTDQGKYYEVIEPVKNKTMILHINKSRNIEQVTIVQGRYSEPADVKNMSPEQLQVLRKWSAITTSDTEWQKAKRGAGL